MPLPILASVGILLAAAPFQGDHVTGGPFVGGDLSFLTTPSNTNAFVFTERLGAQFTYMLYPSYGFGFAINTKGPRSYVTHPLLQFLGSSTEAIQYFSVAFAPHFYLHLGTRSGRAQYGIRAAFGVTWSRWSEVDTDVPFCGDELATAAGTDGCTTTTTTHPQRDVFGYIGRLQHLSMYPLSCHTFLSGGPYFEIEGPRLNGALGVVVELMFNSHNNCTLAEDN